MDPVTHAFDDETLASVDRWLQYRTWHSRVPGAQVAVGLAGEVLLSRGYGYADLEQGIAMREDHLFRIASHSKTFTATLVLQLVEQGLVGLDDPIGRHLPELADDPTLSGIGVRELMEHTGGVLRDGLDGDYWQFDRPFPEAAELLAMIREGGTKAAPGEQFAYSNLGYSLLGMLVEAVTGTPFAEAAATRILEPLGLSDTAADYLPERADDYAVGYTGLNTGPTPRRLEHIPTNIMAAATGFTSTATDLVAYFAGHASGQTTLLSDRTKRLQQRQANPIDPEQRTGGGYGWGMVVEEVDGRTYVGHSGGYPGHITKTLLDPVSGLVVSVLTNAIDGPAAALARGVLQLLGRAEEYATSSPTGPDPVPPLTRETLGLTGRYASLWGVTDIAAVGGRLLALHPADASPLEGADQLEDAGDHRLRIAAGSGTGSVGEFVTFELDGEQVQSMRYGAMSMRPFPEPGAVAQAAG